MKYPMTFIYSLPYIEKKDIDRDSEFKYTEEQISIDTNIIIDPYYIDPYSYF